jgi:arylsulfatase A
MPRPLAFALLLCSLCIASLATPPNIVVILADDLGYGDVQCYSPERGKIPTPHIDRLAAQGMRFTDAHTSSGVCSPSRYALLTGRYHWRSRLQSGIVTYLEKPLIAPDRLTITGLLKQHGYRTAAIGKWHLGWDWDITPEQRALVAPPRQNKSPELTDAHRSAWKKVYAKPIGGGPTTRGFDEYFGTDVPNWPPYAFIRNDRTEGIPTEFLPASKLVKNQAGIPGPALPGWKLEDVLPSLAKAACSFIEDAAKNSKPFFLYMPLTSPHTPIAVNDEWRGKSGLNAYADFVMETDAIVGRVLYALERSGAAKNTLVVFTSDNGCAPYAGAPELEAKGHFPSGPLRGYKADAWEGGHRVPFIVRWPGEVKPGTRCDALVQQTDLMATFAEVLGTKLPATAGEDSASLLPLLRGSEKPVREFAVSCASSGLPALRRGSWKIIFGSGGGGYAKGTTDGAPSGQLYDLANDLGETKNLWDAKPELVAEMTAAMDRIVGAHSNDVSVNWRRFLQGKSK